MIKSKLYTDKRCRSNLTGNNLNTRNKNRAKHKAKWEGSNQHICRWTFALIFSFLTALPLVLLVIFKENIFKDSINVVEEAIEKDLNILKKTSSVLLSNGKFSTFLPYSSLPSSSSSSSSRASSQIIESRDLSVEVDKTSNLKGSDPKVGTITKSQKNDKVQSGDHSNESFYHKDITKTKINTDITLPNIHFIHIPKCAGTTMTAILRQMQCVRNPITHKDCCTNPGYCDWWAKQRCASIKGCTDHFPNRKHIFMKKVTISLTREPLSRIISAFYYRGHSPNLDFFQVRPWFKEISQNKRPKVTFYEYMGMHEYHNIQTRMLGADSFPYRNVTVDDSIFKKAVEALDRIFFMAIQEELAISIELMLREMKVSMKYELKKERDMSNARVARDKEKLKANMTMMDELRKINHYDVKLYKLALKKFCLILRKYSDLWELVRERKKIDCLSYI